jgi:hypothetical protein
MVPLIPIALEIAKLAAPGLIKHLTGSDQAGAVADRVIDAAQAITGTAAPDAALAKLRADPALVLQFHAKALELESQQELALLKDRSDARSRDVELRRLGYHNARADWMVLLDVLGLVVCIAAIIFLRADLSGEVITLLTTIATYFGLSLRDAHQFEFGSSRGSREKDQMLGAKG